MSDPTSTRLSHIATFRNKFEFEKRHFSYSDNCEVIKNSSNITSSRSKEDIVKHMSNLPSYLETQKTTQDKALNFGVMDWGRLEKWQYGNIKQVSVKSNKYSPSSSNYSSLLSTDESSPQSSLYQSCSPGPRKPHRVTLQSHFDIKEPRDCKIYDFHPPNIQKPESSPSSLKGKMKIQDEPGNFQDSFYRTRLERLKNGVVLPKNCHQNSETNAKIHDSSRNQGGSTVSSKNSDLNKQRNISPIRRFSFSVSSKFSGSTSTTKRAESPPVSQKSTRDNSCILNRAHSSPLRRLLEPLFTSKATNSCEDSKIKEKPKLDSPSIKQALFRTTVKNGRPSFTFTVENNNIIAATMKNLSGKDNINSWVYTFFTVHEVKKKNGNWLSPSSKNKGHGYVPNVLAQMKVSNTSIDNNTHEFVLFSVDPGQVGSTANISSVHPHDELAAIVVKFLRNVGDEDANKERFSATVILPGGNHGVSSNGEPSPLIERWLSGGVCDCGGWDLGCQLRMFTSRVRSSARLNSNKVYTTNGEFELFFQGEVVNNRPFFSLSPLKEGIFSVEYNSSLSLLQAFSICISIVESRTYVVKQVEDDRKLASFASFPPVSPVGRV